MFCVSLRLCFAGSSLAAGGSSGRPVQPHGGLQLCADLCGACGALSWGAARPRAESKAQHDVVTVLLLFFKRLGEMRYFLNIASGICPFFKKV